MSSVTENPFSVLHGNRKILAESPRNEWQSRIRLNVLRCFI